MGNYILTINLSDKMIDEVKKHKQLRHKQSIEETVIDLINDALSFPQYFLNYDWEKAESEADYEILSGNTKSFSTIEDFITDLEK